MVKDFIAAAVDSYEDHKSSKTRAEHGILCALGLEVKLVGNRIEILNKDIAIDYDLYLAVKEFFREQLASVRGDLADSSIVREVDNLFSDTLTFHKIPAPKSQKKIAVKVSKSRLERDKRIEDQKLLDKTPQELASAKKELLLAQAEIDPSSPTAGAKETKIKQQLSDISAATTKVMKKEKVARKEENKKLKGSIKSRIDAINDSETLELVDSFLTAIESNDPEILDMVKNQLS